MESRDLALIRFVTRHQAELRGLREVVFGAFIWVAIALTIWRRELGPIASMVYLVQFIVVQEFVLQFVDRRYDATYGRVNPSGGQPARGRWARTTTTQRLIAIVLPEPVASLNASRGRFVSLGSTTIPCVA